MNRKVIPMNAKVGTSVEWEIAETFWGGFSLRPIRRWDRKDVHDLARWTALTMGTAVFIGTSALSMRANKVPQPIADIAVADCAVVAVDLKRLGQ